MTDTVSNKAVVRRFNERVIEALDRSAFDELMAPDFVNHSAPAVAPTSGGSTWLWLLIVALAAGLAYAAGYQSLARRIRKKFGGLRIY